MGEGSTATDIQAGSWLNGYQAVSPAPVEFIKGDRTRYIDGNAVKGSWSDPWWMYDPDRGWAVARRWRSKAQRISMWPEKGFEDFPALEEREVAPWTPPEQAGQQERAEADDAATVRVWDVDAGETREVAVAEAAAGKVRYARRELGPGTPACGEVERQAVELLRKGAGTLDPHDMTETGLQAMHDAGGTQRAAAVRERARRHREAQLAAMRQRAAERRAARTETTEEADMTETVTGTVAVPEAGTAIAQEPRIPGDQLLDLVRDAWLGFFGRYPSPAALDAVTLWAAHTHMRDENGTLVFRATPRLYLLSSEPGSGKSHVLELLMRIAPACHGLDLEPTKAGLVHTLNKEKATVLLDEGDLLFSSGKRHSDVRAVLNGGTYRHGTVLNGKGAKANREPVFGAIALAGLDVMETGTGDALNALMSRGVKIRMEKASGENRPPKLTRQAEDGAAKAKVWLERWAAQVRDEVADADPEVPEGVEGRAEDIWAPLLAVAEAAGRDAAARGVTSDWPDRARAACRELALGKPDGGENLEDEFAEFAGSFGAL